VGVSTEGRNRARASVGDRLGVGLSALCIAHCALTPVALALLPSLNLPFFRPFFRPFYWAFVREDFHVVIAFLIAGAALLAFLPGYRAHGNGRVFTWAVPGFGLIAFAAACGGSLFGPYGEAGLSIVGSALLIQGHRLNRAACACCRKRDAEAPAAAASTR
jgi:hypothetical protein